MTIFNLWENTLEEEVAIEYYAPAEKRSDAAVVIFPGGGYTHRAQHEGKGYAEMLNEWGFTAFVVQYRVEPNYFPKPLLDARRAIQFVRARAAEFGVNKDKIAVMGSSAGGHLAALVSTYKEDIGDLNDIVGQESYRPNAQILCYPVISCDAAIWHKGSFDSLLGERIADIKDFSPELLVDAETPKAFIWHTAEDPGVPVGNSYRYAEALSRYRIACELHVFPEGPHGLGRALNLPHVAQWTQLLHNWLQKYM